MYCRNCGHESNGGDKYCTKCGKELVKVDSPKNQTENQHEIENRRDSRKWKSLVITVAVLIAVCGAVWSFGNEKTAETIPAEEVSSVQPTVHYAEDQWKQNILMSSEVDASIPLGGYRGSAVEWFVFDTELWRSQISRVTFEDSVEHVPENHWDVSLAQNDSVLAWVIPDGSDKYELHIAAEGGINGKIACKDLFLGYSNLEEVNFNGCFHTEQTEDFSRMFYGCMWALEKLDLREIRTDNAVNLSEMFANCVILTTLDISSFDTSHVKDMSGMFSNCMYLQQVSLEGWNTANVTNVSYMFHQCPAVENCDFSGLDFGKVEKYGAFADDTVQINGQLWKNYFSADSEMKQEETMEQAVRESWETGSVELTILGKDHIRMELEEKCFAEKDFKIGDRRLFVNIYHSDDDWNCYEMVVYSEDNALQCHCSYLFAGSAANDYHPQDPTWSVSDGKVTIDMYTGDLVPWDVTELEEMSVYFYNIKTQKYEEVSSFLLGF